MAISNPTHLSEIFLHDMLGSGSPEALHVRLAFPPVGYVAFSNSSTTGLRMTTRATEDSMRPALFSAMQVKVPPSSFTNLWVVNVPVVWFNCQPGRVRA